MYDEHIKAKLYKELRYFNETKEEIDSKYPWEKAEQFNAAIRKLGTAADGSSYMDMFRGLITEIGNAMGYIRMVRSGGLHYTSNAIKFIPDLQNVPNFDESVATEQLPMSTQNAAKNLDKAIGGLCKNFAEGTDYFKMLVAAFAPEFRNENNGHLKNFHMIIPALTINFVNYLLSTKDKVFTSRKGQTPSYCFCDDGMYNNYNLDCSIFMSCIIFRILYWNSLHSEIIRPKCGV